MNCCKISYNWLCPLQHCRIIYAPLQTYLLLAMLQLNTFFNKNTVFILPLSEIEVEFPSMHSSLLITVRSHMRRALANTMDVRAQAYACSLINTSSTVSCAWRIFPVHHRRFICENSSHVMIFVSKTGSSASTSLMTDKFFFRLFFYSWMRFLGTIFAHTLVIIHLFPILTKSLVSFRDSRS